MPQLAPCVIRGQRAPKPRLPARLPVTPRAFRDFLSGDCSGNIYLVQTGSFGLAGCGSQATGSQQSFHDVCQAAEPIHADVYAAVHPAHQRLLQKGGEPGMRGVAALHVLQLRPPEKRHPRWLPGSPTACGRTATSQRYSTSFPGHDSAPPQMRRIQPARNRYLVQCQDASSANDLGRISAEQQSWRRFSFDRAGRFASGGCVAVWVAGWMAVGVESRRTQLRDGRHGDGRGGAILWRGDHRY